VHLRLVISRDIDIECNDWTSSRIDDWLTGSLCPIDIYSWRVRVPSQGAVKFRNLCNVCGAVGNIVITENVLVMENMAVMGNKLVMGNIELWHGKRCCHVKHSCHGKHNIICLGKYSCHGNTVVSGSIAFLGNIVIGNIVIEGNIFVTRKTYYLFSETQLSPVTYRSLLEHCCCGAFSGHLYLTRVMFLPDSFQWLSQQGTTCAYEPVYMSFPRRIIVTSCLAFCTPTFIDCTLIIVRLI